MKKARTTKQIKEDGIRIGRLIEKGYSKKDISFLESLTNKQIFYSIHSYFSAEEARQYIAKLQENKTQKQLVVIDTSIIGVWQLEEKLSALDAILVFSSIVIEELEGLKKDETLSVLERKNVSVLLRLAVKEENKVMPCKTEANLPGWRINTKDARIIRVAWDLWQEQKRDVIVFTADLSFAAIAKSLSIPFLFIDEEMTVPTNLVATKGKETPQVMETVKEQTVQKNTLPTPKTEKVFLKVEEVNQENTMDLSMFSNDAYYWNTRYNFPMYCTYPNDGTGIHILDANDYLAAGTVFYKVQKNCIEQFLILHYRGNNNVLLQKRGYFKEPVKTSDTGKICKFIREIT